MDEIKSGSENFIKIGNEKFVPLITESEIKKRVEELGKKISDDYRYKLPIFIGVLNGSFMFLADLLKHVDIHCEMDFFKLSSYGDSKISSGNVKMLKELNADINERHVIIVEDIVDTGNTIVALVNQLSAYNPKDIKIATLLFKPEAYTKNIKIDYIALEVPNKFLVGYGLDYDGLGRNLESIYSLASD